MTFGFLAGILWALETVTLGVVLEQSPFVSTEQAIFLAPFVSTFLHDLFSSVWTLLFNTVRGDIRKVGAAWKTKNGRFVMLGALIGGPVGMTGYVLAINAMGSSVGAVASAAYPAVGAALACIFLKEKMPWYRWLLLLLTLLGVYGLSYSPALEGGNFALGILGVAMCAFGWGGEAVILAKCLRDESVKNTYALQIRQTTSALVYGAVILPVLKGWGFTVSLFTSGTGMLLPLIALAALFATSSYLFYYRSIARIGASKSMALNVTYAAWALVFTAILRRDASVLTPLTVTCTAVVLVCGVLAAAEPQKLFARKQDDERHI